MAETTIVDIPKMSPARDSLAFQWSAPSPKSTIYLTRSAKTLPDRSETVTITGIHIVLAAQNPNGLWELLHTPRTKCLDPAIPLRPKKRVTIACDTLEVHGELCLPETDVEIFARRLEWCTEDAAINTTPLDWVAARPAIRKDPNKDKPEKKSCQETCEGKAGQGTSEGEAGERGRKGHDAGSVRIFVAESHCTDHTRTRIRAMGGRGQTPGAGLPGLNGNDFPSRSHVGRNFTIFKQKAEDNFYHYELDKSRSVIRENPSHPPKTTFDPPAVHIETITTNWGGKWVPETWGETVCWPTNGRNALAPGVPGDGGDGGTVVVNSNSLSSCILADAGKPAPTPADVIGGKAGEPTRSAKYRVYIETESLPYATTKIRFEMVGEINKTGPGESFHGKPGTPGRQGVVKHQSPCPGDWLHPLSLERLLEYIRDLYLCGDCAETEKRLIALNRILASPLPQNGAWSPLTGPLWTAAANEVASLLCRLRGHLDYYGNPDGFQPILSLSANIELYRRESEQALRTILLANMLDAKALNVAALANTLDRAEQDIVDDSRTTRERIKGGEKRFDEVMEQLRIVERRTLERRSDLKAIEEKLKKKAKQRISEKEERINFIQTLARTADFICQVIPVGQPIVGSVGSLLGAAEKYFSDGEEQSFAGLINAAGELGKGIAATQQDEYKAEVARLAAVEKLKTKEAQKSAELAQQAGDAAQLWAQVGKSIGLACTKVSDAVKQRQVPQAEIDAFLEQLKADDPLWNELTAKLVADNQEKAKAMADLTATLDAVNADYARLTSNAVAELGLSVERKQVILDQVDASALVFVRQMANRSRSKLQRHLYFMVKAYETSALEPIAVDWQLTKITERISAFVQSASQLSLEDIATHVETLSVLFNSNLELIRDKLKETLVKGSGSVQLSRRLTLDRTSASIDELNQKQSVVIQPMALGLLLNSEHRVHLNDVELADVKFKGIAIRRPKPENLVITLVPSNDATIRCAEKFYAIRSEAPRAWKWTYDKGQIGKGQLSSVSNDLLDYLLGKSAPTIREKYAQVPFWSDFTLKIEAAGGKPIPPIEKLTLNFKLDLASAPPGQRVLEIKAIDACGPVAIGCTPDQNGRGDGVGAMLRVYAAGSQVALTIPETTRKGSVFAGWRSVAQNGRERQHAGTTLALTMDEHLSVACHWKKKGLRMARPAALAADDFAASDESADQRLAT